MEEKEINIEELLKDVEAEMGETKADSEAKAEDNAAENADSAAENEEDDMTESAENDGKESQETDALAELQAQVEQLKKDMLYKQAEFDNYRKRTNKEKAELILSGGEKTIKEILPVMDDFERALAVKSDDPQAIIEGMQLIFNKLNSTLEKMGVKKIETADADFDVDFHEAIALVPGLGEAKKGKVIDCVQTGYTLNDKVIRHAKVAVGE